jgi:hypothetical protein
MMMRIFVLSALLFLTPIIAVAQQTAPPKGAPTVSAQVDRTAIWVGDVLRYSLHVVHEGNVEMVLDNFSKERLPLAPFVVRDIDIRRGELAGGKRAVDITLLLSAYETGKSELTIPPVQLFYFVREAGPARKESPVETITAPALKIGLGSTLIPDNPAPRTGRLAAATAPGLAVALAPLGLGLAGLLGLAIYAGIRVWRRLHPHQAIRKLTREARERMAIEHLTRLRKALSAEGDDPLQWSGIIASTLRALVAELYQIPGAALTPEEIETAMTRAGANPLLATQTKSVLAQCDQLRYGKPSSGAASLRETVLQAAERVMQSPQLVAA